MKAALLSLAILGAHLTIPVADRLPRLNEESLCKARSAADRMMNFPQLQSVSECVQAERDAREKLGAVWGTTAGSVRSRCKADAAALGTLTYLDLLTCIQMADDVKSPPPAKEDRGNAGKTHHRTHQ